MSIKEENKLLITEYKHHILTAFYEEGRITGLLAEPVESSALLGNIYVGKVKNIVKNIGAAFVEFEKGQMGYLPLTDKVKPVFTNHTGKKVTEKIGTGDEVIVQIEREAVKTKPPTLSCILDISGKYLVLCVGKKGVSISKKIKDKKEKERLHEILSPYESEHYELIARTNSAGVPKELLEEEFLELDKKYHEIVMQGIHRTVFSKLYETEPLYLEKIKNMYKKDAVFIETDSEVLYEKMDRYIKEHHWQEQCQVSLWKEENGKFSAVYNIEKTLEKALYKRVWLKSGGYLVIEPTEAFVSIDVNTGKAIGKKKDIEAHFLKINLEAAKEIAVQLKLRNLSGIIIVDFIDMKSPEANEELMRVFRQELKKDSVPTKLVDMTKLGLVEVTRKKQRKPLYELINLHH